MFVDVHAWVFSVHNCSQFSLLHLWPTPAATIYFTGKPPSWCVYARGAGMRIGLLLDEEVGKPHVVLEAPLGKDEE